MTFWQTIILGIIQGATEFVPISSSGHLVVIRELFGWEDPGVTFDAALHLGTALAIIIFFFNYFLYFLGLTRQSLKTGRYFDFPAKRYFWYLIIATIPAAVLGVFLESVINQFFHSLLSVSLLFIFTGLCFVLVERIRFKQKPKEKISFSDALWIGFAQVVSVLPGVSRSGFTLVGALSRGLPRRFSIKFVFLLALPITLGSGFFGFYRILRSSVTLENVFNLIVGFILSAGVGYVSIKFLVNYIQRRKLYPFAVYLVLVGIVLLVWSQIK